MDNQAITLQHSDTITREGICGLLRKYSNDGKHIPPGMRMMFYQLV